MAKKLFALAVVACFIIASISITDAVDKKGDMSRPKLSKSLPLPSKSLSLIRDSAIESGQVPLFSDDFETPPMWWPDASWNNTSWGLGRVFSFESGWKHVGYNSYSGTYSWHNTDSLDLDLDFLISPVIYIPDSVTIAGVTSELKGGEIHFWMDLDAPDTDDLLAVYVGLADAEWTFDTTDPYSGTSCWYLEQHHDMMRQWLISPAIDLTANTTATLSYYSKYLTELSWDYLAVDVSTDSFKTYTCLDTCSGRLGTYTQFQYDLTPFVGSVIQIRFRYTADYAYIESGAYWRVDDILVTANGDTAFYDDGGETGVTQMTKGGFIAGSPVAIIKDDGATPDVYWEEVDLGDVLFSGAAQRGVDSLRIGFRWKTDADPSQGRGIFIDDVTIIPIGKKPIDVALIGAKDLLSAILDEPLNAKIVVANVGIDTLNGPLTWIGRILDKAGNVIATPRGWTTISNFVPDQTVTIETARPFRWIPIEPGNYTLDVEVIFAGDGDLTNNTGKIDFTVFGLPFTKFVYRQDFEPRGGETSLEDFGFTVINGGGPVNTWAYFPFVYGYSALLSWAWGNLVAGPEVIDETLITPSIDISLVGHYNTLFLNMYIYFRPGHPAVGAPFGIQYTDISIDYTVDGGQTWRPVWFWADDDTLPGDENRWPRVPEGVPYWMKTEFDLTEAVGNDSIQFRIKVTSDSSYIVGIDIDEIVLYQGIANPLITSVADIPEDQGKQVRVTWLASPNDTLYTDPFGFGETSPITFYGLWRKIPRGATGNATKVFSSTREMLAYAHNAKPGDRFVLKSGGGWDYIATIPALGLGGDIRAAYNYVAPTLWDSVMTTFMVSAHTTDPLEYECSKPMAGMSIDNLAPAPPINVVAAQEDYNVRISWEAPEDPDVRFYSVYRSTESGVYPEEPLVRTSELTFLDETVEIDNTYYYVVTATDYGWNESKRSEEVSLRVTTVRDKEMKVPTTFAMAQNYPNPFNPGTYITYQLPEPCEVTIIIYNLSGQKIRTLVQDKREAGHFRVYWDGKADDGTNVASGVYFYKIQAGHFTSIKKMVLMR